MPHNLELGNRAFENIATAEKGENVRNQTFIPSPTIFSIPLKIFLTIS